MTPMPQPPQGAPQQPAAAAPPLHSAQGPEAAKLHDHALQAEKHLEALATGLAQAHADPGAVKAVASMADVMRKILKSMASLAQAEPPPAQKHTMNSAADGLVADVRANRQQ